MTGNVVLFHQGSHHQSDRAHGRHHPSALSRTARMNGEAGTAVVIGVRLAGFIAPQDRMEHVEG